MLEFDAVVHETFFFLKIFEETLAIHDPYRGFLKSFFVSRDDKSGFYGSSSLINKSIF